MLISGPNLEVKPQPTTQGPVVIQESRIQPTEDHQDCKEWLQRQDCVELSKIRPQAHVEWFVLHYRLQRLENLQWGLSASLPDEQNTFYAQFEASNTFHAEKLPVNCNSCALTITVPYVIRSFKTANTSKAPNLVSSNHVPATCGDSGSLISPKILTIFYKYPIESILTGCMNVWFGSCPLRECKALRRVVRAAELIIGNRLPALQDIFHT